MKISLGRKIVMLVVAITIILIATCIIVTDLVVRKLMINEYITTSDSMASTVAAVADGDRLMRFRQKVLEIYDPSEIKISNEDTEDPAFSAYQAQFLDLMHDEDYIEIRDELRAIQDVSEVDCVYTLYIDTEAKNALYLVDAAHEEDEIVTPGCFDRVEKSCYEYLDDLSQGFPAFVSNTEEYGWMVTSCVPIYTSQGEIACFSAVDLSMTEIMDKVHDFLWMLSGILGALTVLICVIAIIYVKRRIVKPINMLSDAAGQYGHNKLGSAHHGFSDLDIKTGDEIEILLGSMVQMEKDIDTYIENLTRTREQLTTARQQADDMHELAHMDALTGIRNKLAYDKEVSRIDNEINNGFTALGIAMIDLNFLKVINDTYGHECGNYAIKKLSSLICNVFVHSPVFRFGGDEFVVILRNNDYNNIESLVHGFNTMLEEAETDPHLQPWEKISAALGYALFDPATDHCTEDVFKKADKSMYERKKSMKALRK